MSRKVKQQKLFPDSALPRVERRTLRDVLNTPLLKDQLQQHRERAIGGPPKGRPKTSNFGGRKR